MNINRTENERKKNDFYLLLLLFQWNKFRERKKKNEPAMEITTMSALFYLLSSFVCQYKTRKSL